MSSLRVWDIKPVEIDGLLAFITLQDGPKFHFHSLKSAKPLTRRLICQILQPIIDAHGFAETRTPHEDTRQQRFNELLGWEEVGRDDFDVIYRIKRVRGA